MSGLTKIFIVLQLVFSLVVSVLLVLMVSKVEPYKRELDNNRTANVALQATHAADEAKIAALTASGGDTQKALADAIANNAKAQVEAGAKLAASESGRLEALSKNGQLTTQLTSLGTSLATLQEITKQQGTELASLRPQVASFTEKNAELNRVNNDLTNAMRQAEQAIKKLQETNAQLTDVAPKTGAVAPSGDSGQVTLLAGSQTAVQINGKVTDVGQQAGRTQIETGLGSRDGVKINTKFAIYRNNNYVGDALVQKVTPQASVAVVTITKAGETVQKGDVVQSGD